MKYLLTVQFEFEADDDPAARNRSRGVLGGRLIPPFDNGKVKEPEVKLRCVYENKAPRTVDVDLGK